MDALNFEYPDYERLSKGAEGSKRKRVVSVMNRHAARMIKEDEIFLKKKKSSPEPKVTTSKKRKTTTLERKMAEIGEGAPSTPSATEVEEILKVMTESLPIKLLSPLGPELTKLLQKKDEPSAAKKAVGRKKQRIVTVMQVIEETPPPTSASKITPAAEVATATEAAPTEATTVEAATTEATNLESTLSDIDRILLDMAAEEAVAAAEETLATVPGKGKEIAEDISKEKDFNFQNIIGQELSKAEKEELRDYAISCGYQPGALLFGGINEESLGCIRDRIGAKVISTLLKSVGFSKLEADISRYRRQHIVGSLFYSNFKVNFFPLAFHCFTQSMLLSKALRMQQDLEDKKNEVIIEGLESKIKDHEATLEKKDFVLQTMEGSLTEAQAEIARLNSELLLKSEYFEQEKKNLDTKLKAEVEKSSNLQESLKELQDKCLSFGNRCVQRLKQVFNSVGASSEKFEPSVEDLPGTFEHIEGVVDALDEVIAGHSDFCALLASRGIAVAFMKTGCTHGKIVNRPNFSLSPADLTDIPSLARSIRNRFITQI
jgi:hypothetical protein